MEIVAPHNGHGLLNENKYIRDGSKTVLNEKNFDGIDCDYVTPNNLHSTVNDDAFEIGKRFNPKQTEPATGTVEPKQDNDVISNKLGTESRDVAQKVEVKVTLPTFEIEHFPIRAMPPINNTFPKSSGCCCNCHCGSSHRHELERTDQFRRSMLQQRRSSPSVLRQGFELGESFDRRTWTLPSMFSSHPYWAGNTNLVIANSNNNCAVVSDRTETNDRESERHDSTTSGTPEGYGVESGSPSSTINKKWQLGIVKNKGLLMLVLTLVIITISTLTALIYFVVLGNRSGFNHGVTSTPSNISVPKVPIVDIKLNQTLVCGVFPQQYLPSRSVQGRSSNINTGFQFNPMMPENDTRTNVTGRVTGSTPASILQYPWQVSLWAEGRGMTCGGSIILKNWILTAAHCTAAKPRASSWTAYVGMSALSLKDNSPAQKREISQIIQNSLYDDITYDYDVSLMKLKSDLVFNDYVQPICLPPPNHVFPSGMPCYVSGWGELDDSGNSPHPDVLQHAQIDIIGNETCSRPDWLQNLLTSRMLCAGKIEGKKDACQGDSGGPLSCYVPDEGVWMLAGSVSWGIGCGQPKLPGVYARMTFFTEWIWRSIAQNDQSVV
uniref:uncharacterized protein LOC100175462 isoform X3 n=1 Tax=Ciona intestinalis TaxID=7719 RepID=UPI00089DC09D|nr:uncharacterized protein LOC100175462 isoform X3 [Ciona intestinalis]|eukprot:XP_018668968.1 uncharacterized protein LOC100175462 isoform X3 [Ciona intestinalis]